MIKKVVILLLLLMVFGTQAFANEKEIYKFKDVSMKHWAISAINSMVQNNIISGYSDYTFKPSQTVSRAEFAKMMVLALDLPVSESPVSSFEDIDEDNWVSPYVEAAKYYLTGFRTSEGDFFKPNLPAAREDMVIALVKALGYQNETADLGQLSVFADNEEISTNLKKYVAIAVKHKIIGGSKGEDNLMYFNPQDPLTRAQAAVLLYKIMNKDQKVTYEKDDNGSKVTYDDTKTNTNIDDSGYTVPKLTYVLKSGKLVLTWNQISDKRLNGYKVVISKNNSTPEYPDDGYLYWITDRSKTYAVIDNKEPYKNGDFGQYLTDGEKYYFSITAVYNDKKVPGNVCLIKYSGSNGDSDNYSDYSAPYVSATVVSSVYENKIKLSWLPILDSKLQGYKVVISKNNPKPKYPDDGYLYWITDKYKTSAVVDNENSYNGGDFGGYLVPGEKYYFSITAVYSDKKVPGNVLYLTFPKRQ